MLWTRNSSSYEWVKKRQCQIGVCLSRHLQVLMVSFPECFPLDHIANLKHDCFYIGLPIWLKAMVASLKASTNEKTYSDYLQAVREAEKEEAMELSCSQMADNATKPKVMSFFPLWKLKGTQPVKTPAVWVAHLDKDGTDKEEGAESNDPNGIEGMTEEFIVYLARAMKDAQQEEKCCYHCSSPEHFIHECPLVKASRATTHLNQKEGQHQRRESRPLKSRGPSQRHPRRGHPRHRALHIDSLLESWSLHQWYGIKYVAKVRVNGESCMALRDNGT